MPASGDAGRHAHPARPRRRGFVALCCAPLVRATLRPAALLAALPVAGCGFKLRGSAVLPFKTLHASFPPAAASTGADFRRLLRSAGETTLVDRPDHADARLVVLSETREKEIIGFSSTGRPREYQIRLRFGFRLLGRGETELIPYTELLLRRDITTTDTQLVAKEQEEALLYRDMQADLVQQLLRRLSAVKSVEQAER